MKSNNKGFTLIEMAIVLVIIGLILGAVTKGKDMIEMPQTIPMHRQPKQQAGTERSTAASKMQSLNSRLSVLNRRRSPPMSFTTARR